MSKRITIFDLDSTVIQNGDLLASYPDGERTITHTFNKQKFCLVYEKVIFLNLELTII